MNGLLVSVSGVRGVVGKAFTAETALNYARAFGTYMKKGKIAIGRDTRRTGQMITSAVVSGLQSTGCDVIDMGVCPTPTIEIAVKDGGYYGGIAITASHNPDNYNALKLIGKGGLFLSETQGRVVQGLFKSKRFNDSPWNRIGSVIYDDKWIDYHIKKILALDIISAATIKKRKLMVVVDCVGGAACFMADKFFSKIGVKYKLIYSKPTGKFPRGPEPTPENLSSLSRAVRKYHADIGFAFDPDADRLAIVAENGNPIGEEYTLALGARFILSRKSGPMAVNLSSSMMNDFVAKEAGVRLYRTKVGERNVTEKLLRTGGVVGGEGNGGLIYPGLHSGRDGFLAAAVILQYMSTSKSKISDLVRELPQYVMIKTKLNLSRHDVDKKIKALEKVFSRGKINKLDGIRIAGKDWWIQIRASNTEPITRMMAEAKDKKTAKDLVKTAKSVFKNISGGI